MLCQMKDDAEIVIVISAGDIEKNKVRSDLGITYDMDVLLPHRRLPRHRSVCRLGRDHAVRWSGGCGRLQKSVRPRSACRSICTTPSQAIRAMFCSIVSDEGYGRNE